MKTPKLALCVSFLALGLAGCGGGAAAPAPAVSSAPAPAPVGNLIPSLQPYATPSGSVSTFSAAGSIDPSAIFYQALGTNGRSCASCHQLSHAMSFSAASAQALFTSSQGADPLFDTVDGANCPGAAIGDAAGHSLILGSGLIRVAEELPASSQFHVVASQDPYGCAQSPDVATGQPILSVYRRPLPTTGLDFLSDVMWDARESIAPLDSAAAFDANLDTDLAAQAANAVATHEQGNASLTSAELAQLVAFERGLYSAEASDTQAGALDQNGATAAAANLAAQSYTPGVNDSAAGNPPGTGFNPVVFTLFQAWRNSANPKQASIARGEDIFNTAPMRLADVGGLNDAPGAPAVLPGSCSSCHDTPNVGSRSTAVALNTGTSVVADAGTPADVLAGLQQLAMPSLPAYQITGCLGPGGNPVTITTTDPGKGVATGLCSDVNRFKIPSLRGLAARAPYFHNGSAPDLPTLVNFYNARFQMNLNPQQRQDLANFLSAL